MADPVRMVAYEVLQAVTQDDAYSNLTLPAVIADAGLDGRDAAFATNLTYGTLRWQGLLDQTIAASSSRPLAEIDPAVLNLLRLGAFQMMFMRVPPHASVAETVQLTRVVAGESRTKFVNAIMRRIGERDVDDWIAQVAPDAHDNPVGHLSVAESHPEWVVRALHDSLTAWRRQQGQSTTWAEVEDLLITDNEPAEVTLVVRPGRADMADFLRAHHAEPGRFSPFAARIGSGAPSELAEVRAGDVGVQDEGSQLVVQALVDAPVHGSDSRWLDMAAGPGGKAALLAAIGAQRGASLVASDRSEHRAQLVQRVLAGSPGEHRTIVADGRDPAWPASSFDRVLLDAPCTGLGAIRRRPESRWRRSSSDVSVLSTLQRELLMTALTAVRPGGVVGYATCSPHLAETELVVDDVCARVNVERLDVRPLLPQVPDLGAGPDLRLWPHLHGTDGMYLALLRRL
jgi:16S rRNA (cytosine967-C5)-methyltransferase